jgi:hypothetical protein
MGDPEQDSRFRGRQNGAVKTPTYCGLVEFPDRRERNRAAEHLAGFRRDRTGAAGEERAHPTLPLLLPRRPLSPRKLCRELVAQLCQGDSFQFRPRFPGQGRCCAEYAGLARNIAAGWAADHCERIGLL